MMPARYAYDFWPWPGVDLINEKPWPPGVAWENRAVKRPEPAPETVPPMGEAEDTR